MTMCNILVVRTFTVLFARPQAHSGVANGVGATTEGLHVIHCDLGFLG
jgi:hypothetical protein